MLLRDFFYSGTQGCRQDCVVPTPPGTALWDASGGNCTATISGVYGHCSLGIADGFAVAPGYTRAAAMLDRSCYDNTLTGTTAPASLQDLTGLEWVNDFSTLLAGDPLLLRARFNAFRPLATASPTNAWQYRWTSPELGLSSVLSSEPSMDFDGSFTAGLAAGTVIHLTLNVTAPDSTAMGLLTREILVQAPPPLVVPVVVGVDPCVAQNPCQNGGRCIATLDSTSGAGSFNLSCACPSSPVRFFGPLCSFAVIGCPSCISSYDGNRSITLLGLGLGYALNMTVRGRPVAFQYRGIVNASADPAVAEALATLRATVSPSRHFDAVTSLEAYTFLAPRLSDVVNSTTGAVVTQSRHSFHSLSRSSSRWSSAHETRELAVTVGGASVISSYQPLDVQVLLPTVSLPLSFVFPTLVYYSVSTCLEAGQFRQDGQGGCTPCPDKAFCPGSGRAWPLEGVWSVSEFEAPAECPFPSACIGVGSRALAASTQGAGEYFRDNRKCADGYEGVRCTVCSEGYYQLNKQCVFCGQSSSEAGALALTVIICLALIVCFGVAVASLSTEKLTSGVGWFCLLQTLVAVGLPASQQLPSYSKEVSGFFVYLNLINFELEVLRPGCGGVPTFTFVRKYQFTLLFMAIGCFIAFLACVARLIVKISQAEDRALRAAGGGDANSLKAALGGGGPDSAAAAAVSSPKDQTVAVSPKSGVYPKSDGPESEAEIVLPPVPPFRDFKQRLAHVTLIVLAILYFKIVMLLLQTFQCVYAADPMPPSQSLLSDVVPTYSLYVQDDYSTQCYVGAHNGLVAGSIILFLVFAAGLPLWLFVLLMRSFSHPGMKGAIGWLHRHFAFLRKKSTVELAALAAASKARAARAKATGIPLTAEEQLEDSKAAYAAAVLAAQRSETFGFLFDGFRGDAFLWSLWLFLVQFLSAAIIVFAPDASLLLLFLFGLLYFFDLSFAVWSWNQDSEEGNRQMCFWSMVALAETVVLLAIQPDGPKSGYFIAVCVGFGVAMIAAGLRLTPLWPGPTSTEDADAKGKAASDAEADVDAVVATGKHVRQPSSSMSRKQRNAVRVHPTPAAAGASGLLSVSGGRAPGHSSGASAVEVEMTSPVAHADQPDAPVVVWHAQDSSEDSAAAQPSAMEVQSLDDSVTEPAVSMAVVVDAPSHAAAAAAASPDHA